LFNKLSSWCFGRYAVSPAGILMVLGYGLVCFISGSLIIAYLHASALIAIGCLLDLKELFGDGAT